MKAKATLISLAPLICFFLVLSILLPPASLSQSNNQGRDLKVVKSLPDRSKRYALVIGVDEYRDKQINRTL